VGSPVCDVAEWARRAARVIGAAMWTVDSRQFREAAPDSPEKLQQGSREGWPSERVAGVPVAGRTRTEDGSSAPTKGWRRGEARVRCRGTEAITAGSGIHKHSCYGDAEGEGEGRRMESRGTPAWTASASAGRGRAH
jgi:hypothetical protein